MRGSWRPNRTEIFWPPLLWPSTLSFSFSWCSTGGPGVHSAGCWVLAFFTASHRHLLWTPIHQDPKPLRPDVGLPTTSRPSPSPTLTGTGTRTGTQLSYIIVQRPLDRPLDLWNRMFNRHQAEITVMQFIGHSLPVHQSMRVSWDFLACPIC